MNVYGVILFYGTQAALRAEKILKQAGYVVKLVPTPRELSSDCGIAVRFSWIEAEGVQVLLDRSQLEFANIASLDR